MRSICHFSTVHRVDDTRVFFREVKGLLSHGIEVTLIARKGTVLPGHENLRTIIFPEFKSRLVRMTFGNLKMFRLVHRIKADVYQFHDPELLVAGLCLRLLGKKVVYDVHEDVKKQILSKQYLTSFKRRMLSGFIGGLERNLVKYFSGIVCVIPNMLEDFDIERKVLFRNFPDPTAILNAKPVPKGRKFRIIYPGSLSENRGIIDVLDAIEMLGNDIELVLLGRFSDLAFEKRCRDHQAWKKVRYEGRVPLGSVYSEILSADLGLQYVKDRPSYRVGYPVKVFEFLSAGLPTIVSDIGNRRSLFGEHAIYVKAENPAELSCKIREVQKNIVEFRRRASDNAASFREHHNYEHELNKYILFFESVSN